MRTQHKVPFYSALTFWPSRVVTQQRHEGKKWNLELFQPYKKLIETVLITLFVGSLLLCGCYLFLTQLAQYGW